MPDHDPLDALRAADPVDVDRLPHHDDAAPAALLREITMSTTTTTPAPVRRPTPRWLLAAAAVVAVAAIGAGVALTAGDDAGEAAVTTVPDPGSGIDPGGISAMCVEVYDLTSLAGRETAFAGTVTAVDGDQVTFAVERWYRGGDSAEITLTSSAGGAITPDGGPALEPGTRLLVAGDGGFAWGCGFTQPYDDAVAAQWAEAFSG